MRHKPRRQGKRPRAKSASTNPNYRPADWKPSWQPKKLCPLCDKKLGIEYLPVIYEGIEYHYECLSRRLREKEREQRG